MSINSLPPELEWAIQAAQDKKAEAITVLDLQAAGGFTGHFLICTGYSRPQIQAISDSIEEQLLRRGIRASHTEGYELGDWVLLDYGFFVVHVLSERARLFYDIERLWRVAPRLDVPDFDSAKRER